MGFKVIGEQIKVEAIMEFATPMDKTGVFKGVVKILQFGTETNTNDLEVGDKILLKPNCLHTCPFTKEGYVYREQILRTYN